MAAYTMAPDIYYDVRRRGDGLEDQRNGRPATEVHDETPDVLFVPGRPLYRYVFRRDPSGRITGFAERRRGLGPHLEKVRTTPTSRRES